MNSKWKLFLFIFLAGIGLDHLTKYWVVRTIPLGEQIDLFPPFFDLVHYRNTGAAFGMFADWTSPYREIFFTIVSILALGLLTYYLVKTPLEEKRTLIPLLLILSGAFGNILDRLTRGNVVDFILLHWGDKTVNFQLLGSTYRFELVWPAFNIADSFISLGVFYLFLSVLSAKPQSLNS